MAEHWFGESWGSPVCKGIHLPTPVGSPCGYCDENIVQGDQGIFIPAISGQLAELKPWHIDCFLRTVVGSVGHQSHQCSCYGGHEEDPPGMSKREAATAAAKLYRSTLTKRESNMSVFSTGESFPVSSTLFCLELGSEEGSDRYFFWGQGSQFEFEQKCNELMKEAARLALEQDEKSDYHYVSWENIIECLAGLLPKHGYQRVSPKMASYRQGLLNPISADVNFEEIIKSGMAGSYELLGEYGPKITDHNMKANNE